MHDEELYDKTEFTLTHENLHRVENNINQLLYKVTNRDSSPIFTKIVIPNDYLCCGKLIGIKSLFASVKVYDLEFVYDARSYHGKCKICKSTFYHGYRESPTGERIFNTEHSEIFIFNSGIAFSLALMKYIDSMVSVGSVSFEKVAGIYQSVLPGNNINPDRIENAWFVHRILQYKTCFSIWPRKCSNRELDVEELCRLVYKEVKSVVDGKWLSHK